jgi:hypothetical protein
MEANELQADALIAAALVTSHAVEIPDFIGRRLTVVSADARGSERLGYFAHELRTWPAPRSG